MRRRRRRNPESPTSDELDSVFEVWEHTTEYIEMAHGMRARRMTIPTEVRGYIRRGVTKLRKLATALSKKYNLTAEEIMRLAGANVAAFNAELEFERQHRNPRRSSRNRRH